MFCLAGSLEEWAFNRPYCNGPGKPSWCALTSPARRLATPIPCHCTVSQDLANQNALRFKAGEYIKTSWRSRSCSASCKRKGRHAPSHHLAQPTIHSRASDLPFVACVRRMEDGSRTTRLDSSLTGSPSTPRTPSEPHFCASNEKVSYPYAPALPSPRFVRARAPSLAVCTHVSLSPPSPGWSTLPLPTPMPCQPAMPTCCSWCTTCPSWSMCA